MTDKKIIAYKGFDSDLKCRGFQYEIGQTYTIKEPVVICRNGFHSCEHPLDVFRYYPPASSRFAAVEAAGDTDRCEDDSKLASASLTITAEISLHDMIGAAVKWVFDRVNRKDGATNEERRGAASNSGVRGAASNSGDGGAASNSGVRGAASNSGVRGAASNSGDGGAASNSGDEGAASNSGDGGAASNSGDGGAASNSGVRGAASNSGVRGAASNSGFEGAASNSGVRGAASNSGDEGAASALGQHSVALDASGTGKARAIEGAAIILIHRGDEGEILNVVSAIAGRDGIQPETWYTLDDAGELVEVSE